MKTVKFVSYFILILSVAIATFSPTAQAQTSSNGGPFQLVFYYPTNGQTYVGPTNVALDAYAVNSTAVHTMTFFSGTTVIGIVTNIGSSNSFFYNWPGVGLGTYTLTAVGADISGNTATSAPVTIMVQSPRPVPFAVGWYNPANGQTFTAPASVGLYASVTDSNIVRTMQYFVNSTLLATVTNLGSVPFTNTTAGNPFSYSWTNVAAGSYALTAVATDTTGAKATSAPITITVGPTPPNVSLYSPVSGNTFLNPANLSLDASSLENNSTIQQIEFLAGTNVLGIVTNSTFATNTGSQPFYAQFSWPNPPPGNYALTAVAMDAAGTLGTSSVVNISILGNPPPVPFAVGWYFPTNGETYTAAGGVGMHASVTDSNTVSTVQYFANSSLIATFTNTVGVLFTNANNGNPFFFLWNNVTEGTYVLTAVATDMTGATATSAPITIAVQLPPPFPGAAILSPVQGDNFLYPTNVSIYAEAVENNGPIAIQHVEFFSGTNLLGIVTNSAIYTNLSGTVPLYEFTWVNPPPGIYALAAVAVDALGNRGTSTIARINVVTNLPPPPIPFVVGWYSPTNGQTFSAPAAVGLHASVTDSYEVRSMTYYANSSLIGEVTISGQFFTNISTGNPFSYGWSNVSAGTYVLTAVATDSVGNMATSPPITISVQSSSVHPRATIATGFGGNAYLYPANVDLHAFAVEVDSTIRQIQLFAGTNLITTLTNPIFKTDFESDGFTPDYSWLSPPPGNYALTAVAMDAQGNLGTSSVVNISVLANPPAVPFVVGWQLPSDGQTYTAPASLGLNAWVCDSNTVTTLQYFANSTLIATFTNTSEVLLTNVGVDSLNLFGTGWYNVPMGTYVLTAVATDTTGVTATGAITIYVHASNEPPVVRITSPPNAAIFRSPVNIPIYAYAHDVDGYVLNVEFFAGAQDLGPGTRIVPGTNAPATSTFSNYFFRVWTNAPIGAYALTAKATDNSNAVTVSPPVNITVLPYVPPPTNPIPVVSISAIDPVAIEGTNCWVWPGLSNAAPDWAEWAGRTMVAFTNCGPKNATFRVYHSGDTNSPVTVAYSLSGTASNGVDYVTLPGSVTIPVGQRTAMISVVPIDDGVSGTNLTVILKLTASAMAPPSYDLGWPTAAEAVILNGPPTSAVPTATVSVLPDRTLHLNTSGPNGAWFHIEASTDMQTWTPICTNQVVNGSIDFADPDGSNASGKFYRAVPETNPPQ